MAAAGGTTIAKPNKSMSSTERSLLSGERGNPFHGLEAGSSPSRWSAARSARAVTV